MLTTLIFILSIPADAIAATVEADPPPEPSGGSGEEAREPGNPVFIDWPGEAPPGAPVVSLLSSDVAVDVGSPMPSLNFDGIIQPHATAKRPPDTHIAVGSGEDAAGRIVAVTNVGARIYDKLGTSP
jgi:hypothetical protein